MHAQALQEKQRHTKQDAKSPMSPMSVDCCGDTCVCGMGNCHMAPVLPAQTAQQIQILGTANATARHAPLHGVTPELPTPPPKA